jgi:hypothetical protein
MVSKKGALEPSYQAYRDDPDHAETASMASAVLLDDIEAFPDEELPPYEDNPVPRINAQDGPYNVNITGLPDGNENYEGWT